MQNLFKNVPILRLKISYTGTWKSLYPEPLNLSDFPGTGDLEISGTGNFRNDKNHHFLSQKISNRILPKLIEFTRDTVTGDLNSALIWTIFSFNAYRSKVTFSFNIFAESVHCQHNVLIALVWPLERTTHIQMQPPHNLGSHGYWFQRGDRCLPSSWVLVSTWNTLLHALPDVLFATIPPVSGHNFGNCLGSQNMKLKSFLEDKKGPLSWRKQLWCVLGAKVNASYSQAEIVLVVLLWKSWWRAT